MLDTTPASVCKIIIIESDLDFIYCPWQIHMHYTLSQWRGPAKKAIGLLRQEVTNLTIYHMHINDFNTEKTPQPSHGDLTGSGPGNMQPGRAAACMHAWKPHTNRVAIFFCILSYLNIIVLVGIRIELTLIGDITEPTHYQPLSIQATYS